MRRTSRTSASARTVAVRPRAPGPLRSVGIAGALVDLRQPVPGAEDELFGLCIPRQGEAFLEHRLGLGIRAVLHGEGAFAGRPGDLPVHRLVVEADRRGVVPVVGEDHPVETRPVGGRQAHRAGLAAGVEDGAGQLVPAQAGAGSADGDDFGVRRGVEVLDHPVAPFPDDLAAQHHDGAEAEVQQTEIEGTPLTFTVAESSG